MSSAGCTAGGACAVVLGRRAGGPSVSLVSSVSSCAISSLWGTGMFTEFSPNFCLKLLLGGCTGVVCTFCFGLSCFLRSPRTAKKTLFWGSDGGIPLTNQATRFLPIDLLPRVLQLSQATLWRKDSTSSASQSLGIPCTETTWGPCCCCPGGNM